MEMRVVDPVPGGRVLGGDVSWKSFPAEGGPPEDYIPRSDPFIFGHLAIVITAFITIVGAHLLGRRGTPSRKKISDIPTQVAGWRG